MTDADLDRVLGPNLVGVVYAIRAAARWMRPGSSDRISNAGLEQPPEHVARAIIRAVRADRF